MATLPQLTFRISKLWGQAQGSVEKQQIDQPISYPKEERLDLAGNFEGDLMLIRLKDEISVILSDASIKVHFNCTACLKSFTQTIKIPGAEREFHYDTPSASDDDPYDLFFIDNKTMTIDLSEMVRQEIILHFPFIPVCSKSCKGLCMHCGKNKNKEKCACKNEEKPIHKPFQNLKQLLGSPKNN